MTAERIGEFVAAAKSFGKQTLAHASGDAGIERVIDGGVDSIEHGFFVRDDQLAKMRDRQIAWVPTFAPVQKQVDHADRMGWDAEVVANLKKILDAHAKSLVEGSRNGRAGDRRRDAGSYGVAHGLGLLYELELMERAGLSAAGRDQLGHGRRLEAAGLQGEIRADQARLPQPVHSHAPFAARETLRICARTASSSLMARSSRLMKTVDAGGL